MSNNLIFSNKTSSNNNLPKFLNYFLISLIVGSACLFLLKIFYSIFIGYTLDHVSGAWIGLAMDFSEGIFYRPLFAEETGFGGTRFFPLFFSLHALMIKIFGRPILSGHIISLFSGVLLFVGCFLLLRQRKTKPLMAIGLISLLLSEASIQLGLSSIRGDILPLGLNVIGFVCFLSKYPPKYRFFLTSSCFVLAFSAKVTAINGILSLFFWLILNKRKKEAWMILLYTSMGCIIFLSILYFGTSGRILSIFTISASGGANLLTLLKAPINFTNKLTHFDPLCLLFLFWASIAICKYRKSITSNLLYIFWLISTILTIILFGSPGISINHFVDIAVASILVIGSTEFKYQSDGFRPSIYLYLILIVFSTVYNITSTHALLIKGPKFKETRYPQEIMSVFNQNDATVLSEDPMLPIMGNKTPYLLDPFMLRLLILNNKDIASLLFDRIDHQKYSAIIFTYNPFKDVDRYSNTHFGYNFIDKVIENYKVGAKKEGYTVYVPK